MEFKHIPVLLNEVLNGLNIEPDGIYLDATIGGAGHSSEILKRLNQKGLLIGNDKDSEAIKAANSTLEKISDNFKIINDDFKNIITNLDELNIDLIDGILVDLGVSSYQIDNAERGFSYIANAKLDMRMNQNQKTSAYEVVNFYEEDKLSKIIWEYGEDRFSRKIARRITEERKIKPIETTEELAKLIENVYPRDLRFKYGNPAKKTFQAIRIEVNGELDGLYDVLYKMALRLKKGGRMCVITFHSLEDRIVKQCFNYLEADCICDKKLPICVCNKVQEIKLINNKPITASEEELKNNKRADSAKLRIIERL
jgi:16S rRNA (cytosine1402-N4)-methyltransferase